MPVLALGVDLLRREKILYRRLAGCGVRDGLVMWWIPPGESGKGLPMEGWEANPQPVPPLPLCYAFMEGIYEEVMWARAFHSRDGHFLRTLLATPRLGTGPVNGPVSLPLSSSWH